MLLWAPLIFTGIRLCKLICRKYEGCVGFTYDDIHLNCTLLFSGANTTNTHQDTDERYVHRLLRNSSMCIKPETMTNRQHLCITNRHGQHVKVLYKGIGDDILTRIGAEGDNKTGYQTQKPEDLLTLSPFGDRNLLAIRNKGHGCHLCVFKPSKYDWVLLFKLPRKVTMSRILSWEVTSLNFTIFILTKMNIWSVQMDGKNLKSIIKSRLIYNICLNKPKYILFCSEYSKSKHYSDVKMITFTISSSKTRRINRFRGWISAMATDSNTVFCFLCKNKKKGCKVKSMDIDTRHINTFHVRQSQLSFITLVPMVGLVVVKSNTMIVYYDIFTKEVDVLDSVDLFYEIRNLIVTDLHSVYIAEKNNVRNEIRFRYIRIGKTSGKKPTSIPVCKMCSSVEFG